MKPFRFGVSVTRTTSREDWREKARRVEQLGYGSLVIGDHLSAQLSPLPALVAAADATSTLRLGSFVLVSDFHHPVFLAKEAATVDVLSAGRLEFGIGAGWQRRDYEMSGLPYDRARDRVSRLEEAVRLIRRLWTEATVEHKGRWFAVRSATVLPRTVQQPHPPILIGCGGPRMLRVAAESAEIVSLNPRVTHETGKLLPGQLTAATVGKKAGLAYALAAKRARRIELNVVVFEAMLTDDRRPVIEEVAQRFGCEIADIADSPHFLIGSAASIRDQLREQRERFGITYYVLPYASSEHLASVVVPLSGD